MRIWVIEKLSNDHVWEPTQGYSTRVAARDMMDFYKMSDGGSYRIRKYTRTYWI